MGNIRYQPTAHRITSAVNCRPLKPSPRSICPAAPYPTGGHIPGIPPPAKFATEPDLVTVVGHAATISAGEWMTASGEWINDRAHGQQFKARFLKASAPSSIDGIEKYLGSGMIRG